MFLRANFRHKDGKEHTYWSLVETVRTPDGPRQRTLCYLGELNGSAQARWLKTLEVFNDQGESHQLKLFPSDVEPPEDDAAVARAGWRPDASGRSPEGSFLKGQRNQGGPWRGATRPARSKTASLTTANRQGNSPTHASPGCCAGNSISPDAFLPCKR
jgi:hypothetical protein